MRPTSLLVVGGPGTTPFSWTAVPVALTEINSVVHPLPASLALFREWRMIAYLTAAASSGAKFRALYDAAAATAIASCTTMGAGGEIAIDATGSVVGAWTSIPLAARADVFLRFAGYNGNASSGPTIRRFEVQLR